MGKNGNLEISWIPETTTTCSGIITTGQHSMTPTVETIFPEVRRVIFAPPATIIYWTDGTKTVVKCMNGDEFSEEIGFVMAWMKRVLGDNYKAVIRNAIKDATRCPERHKKEKPKTSAGAEFFAKDNMDAIERLLKPVDIVTPFVDALFPKKK